MGRFLYCLLPLLALAAVHAQSLVRHEIPIEGTDYFSINYLPEGVSPPNSSRVDARIVGGTTAAIDEFGSIVLFKPDAYMCGAVLLNSRTALTAAHCCDGNSCSFFYSSLL